MRRLALCILALAAALPASASAKSIEFQGREVEVPAGWPVVRLAEQPRTCVRLDRRAVYLGTPSSNQRCPASAMGRRRAILVDPGAGARAARARAEASRVPPARISASGFTGLGFDACTAPSRRSMSAWLDSPYRAIGVYIGGLNRGCSQPNLTASWVAEQVAAGWSLIPTYVGLQAPTSSCTSCATLSTSGAGVQGAAAADDAVAQAAAIGMGRGSPIYYDMESYSRTASATNATLTFLAAWTERLHELGYESGVYSSSASGIADLVSRLGNPLYQQPDHIWMANWNGVKSASDPYVPSYAWNDHQRIHQYRGGHDETWGGVTINIDNNYVEGGTVGTAVASGEDPKGFLDSVEALSPGQVRLTGWAFDPSDPLSTVSIRAYVGGKAGKPGAIPYDLGPVATQPRPDITTVYRAAGPSRGFDATFATAKSGRERICAYAVNVGSGSDRALGCRTIGIPVPIEIAHVAVRRNGLRVAVRCEWPAGTECPGQILLRARTRVPTAGARRRTSSRVVRVGVARRQFMLTGARSRVFHVPLSRRGLELAALSPERLRAQLLVAFPDGRIGQPVTLRRPSG